MCTENVKVSFVIPVYNAEPFLKQCIESIKGQTVNTWEMILVDNGSTDGSGTVCDQYAKEDSRITVIHQENKGPASARNIGVKQAKGKWISFIDSDDWIEVDYIEKLEKYFDNEYELIFYAYDIVSEKDVKRVLARNAVKEEVSEEQIKLLEKQSIDTGIEKEYTSVSKYRGQVWTKLYNKDFLLKNELRARENLMRCQDVMFNLEVYGKAKKAVFIPEVLYHYRHLAASLCHQHNEVQKIHLDRFAKEMGKYLKETGKTSEYEKSYDIRLALILINCCFLDFCHPMNKNSYKERKQKFVEMRNSEPYASALSRVDEKSMGLVKGILVWAEKRNWFFLLCIFSYIEKKLRRG